MKWILATLVVGENAFQPARDAFMQRSGITTYGNFFEKAWRAIMTNASVSPMLTATLLLAFALALIALIVTAVRSCTQGESQAVQKSLLVAIIVLIGIAALAYIWYSVTSNHALEHADKITYRTQILAVFALLEAIVLFWHTKPVHEQPPKEKHDALAEGA